MSESATVIVAYCRAGFEGEVIAELREVAALSGTTIDGKGSADDGFVIGSVKDFNPTSWQRALQSAPPIFSRSVFAGRGPLPLLDAAASGGRPDRVSPLLTAIDALAALPPHAPPWQSVWLEYPDTNDGKAMSPLARSLHARIDGTLRAAGHLHEASTRRLHIFITSGAAAFIGTSERDTGSPWPLGIPRLSMPGRAPSRSTLKLAEAFATFLAHRETTLLRPGLLAVDLGAAPGGWTWQLTQRGLRVTAVDNGPLKGDVATDPKVTHLREDGLAWRPRRPVDWVVCDIVEQPMRIAELMASWVADGAARRAVFNLKLPMKKRYAEVQRCRAHIEQTLTGAGIDYVLRVKHLYHDREEVTGYLERR